MVSRFSKDLRFAAAVLRRRPFQVLLQVTNRCNMTCNFCDFWPNGIPHSEELSVDDYRRLEEQLARIGSFVVSVEGGEPFVRPDLVEILEVFGERHLPSLYTNGWFVDEAVTHRIWAAGTHLVGVSIDYPQAERHDARRGMAGATERAWRAVRLLRDGAPAGGDAVHVMTVVMDDNRDDLEALLRQSADEGVRHCLTLVATGGYRRGAGAVLPASNLTERLRALWRQFPHLMVPRGYLDRFDAFLDGGELPQCRAGQQSFNVDHRGDVSSCIERIDHPAGNVRSEPLDAILARLRQDEAVASCQDCWTFCRGFAQELSGGGSPRAWWDLATRMRVS